MTALITAAKETNDAATSTKHHQTIKEIFPLLSEFLEVGCNSPYGLI